MIQVGLSHTLSGVLAVTNTPEFQAFILSARNQDRSTYKIQGGPQIGFLR